MNKRKPMIWNKQKIQLVSAVTALIVSGFLITSLASYFVSRASLRSKISVNELPLTSDNIYSEIQQDLLRPVFISSMMAADTFLRDWVINGEAGEQQIIKYLKEIKLRYKTFTSFFVSDKTGIYYQAEGILKKVSPDNERDAWYFRIKEMKEDYEINLDPDQANKDAMTVFINYRVFDYKKNYIGATGVGLAVSSVKKLIELYQTKYNRTIYFIDKNGEIKLTGSGFDNKIKNISALEYYPLFKDMLSSAAQHTFSYKKNGQVVHTNIRYIEEFEWYLIVEQSEQETLKQIYKTLLINLGICLIITIVVLLLVNLSISSYQKKVDDLRDIVPICSFCNQIRDDKGYWNKVEAYIAQHTDAQLSHSICPSCMEKHYPEEYEKIKKKREEKQNQSGKHG